LQASGPRASELLPGERQPAAKGSPSAGWALADGHSPTEAADSSQSWVLATGSTNSPRHCAGMNCVYRVQPGAKQTDPERRLETSPHEGSIQ